MSQELDNKVPAATRSAFGKGAARKIRATGHIPAVVYGHGTAPIHVTVPAHQVGLLLRKANALLDLQLESGSQLVLVKDVQKDPVRQIIEHLDLIVVTKGEKVQVDVPVHLIGDTFPGTVAEIEAHTVSLEAEATHIPEFVELSVEGAHEGAHFYAKDIVLPKGSALVTDAEALIVAVHLPQKAAEEAPAAEAAPASAAAEAPAE